MNESVVVLGIFGFGFTVGAFAQMLFFRRDVMAMLDALSELNKVYMENLDAMNENVCKINKLIKRENVGLA